MTLSWPKIGPMGERRAASTDAQARRVLAGDSRSRVLEILREAGRPMSVAALAEQRGLHVNTVRAHLDLLTDTGFVRRISEHRTSPGRPRVLYEATARSLPSSSSATVATNYRILAEVLVHQIASSVDDSDELLAVARRAGRTWAAAVPDLVGSARPVDDGSTQDALVAMMSDLGFEPKPDQDGPGVRMLACPYVEGWPDLLPVVCGVHQGLIEGSLERLGVSNQRVELDVALDPVRCHVRLHRAAADGSGTGAPTPTDPNSSEPSQPNEEPRHEPDPADPR